MSSPLPELLKPLTVPASWVYGSAIAARNARFDRGVGVESIDRPVISVGNLTTGGTGKTPIVMWIAEQLCQAGSRPLIAMRGYGASADHMSDEQLEYRERLPKVPVLANPDRTAALREFLPRHPDTDCVILDDGFQHRQIKRDLDLVLIDAQSDALHDRLLPAGNLRERPESLRRADAVIMTHATEVDADLARKIQGYHGKEPIAWSRHVWTKLAVFESRSDPNPPSLSGRRLAVEWRGLGGGSSAPTSIDRLCGRRVLTMLGVAKPQSILNQLERIGANVAVNIPCGDHERFTRSKVAMARGLCEGCHAMVVTGKDWVKLRDLIDLAKWPAPIVVPQLEIEVFEGENELRERVLAVTGTPTAGKPAR